MQSWSRQSQCVFCLLRPSVKLRASLIARRDLAAVRALNSEYRHRQSKTDREGPVVRRVHARNLRNDDRLGIKRGRTPREEKEIKEISQKDIDRAVKEVHSYYLQGKMSQNSSVPQMRVLDPEGILWPQFETLIKQAFLSGSLSTQIMAASESSNREDLVRQIRFAFLDYVLDHQGVDTQVNVRSQLDTKYPTEWYPKARQIQRTIHLHVGPTNSGKTYNALKRLEAVKDGFYAGPLRLLAHEVYSRFNNRDVKCNLVTGDDIRLDEAGDVKLYASTVEMVDASRECEVGIVDEIQMIGDIERGWAWTRALLAAQCKELHLCGEARVVPLIRELVASMGDTLHIHQYERLNPLKVMSRSLRGDLRNLRKGDCVVSFSIVNIHALKRQIELDTGRRCAIVYGSLPPETRAQQAALFNDPDNDYDYLVASDAIGMGLNLSIKRIVFEATSKWNGKFRERLSVPQIKQIAGRAGRFRSSQDDKKTPASSSSSAPTKNKGAQPQNIGLVTCLDEADLPVLQHALSSEGAPLQAAGIMPPGEIFDNLAAVLPEDTPFEYILRRVCATIDTHQRFNVCSIKDQLVVARWLEGVKGLTVPERLLICASPASYKTGLVTAGDPENLVVALAEVIAAERTVTVADLAEIPLEVLDEPMTADREYLVSLEALHKSLILYLWLHYRFYRRLTDKDMAFRAKELCEDRINATLIRFSANPKLVKRLQAMRKSSDLLLQQARAGHRALGTTMTLNPDRTVEEIDTAVSQDRAGTSNPARLEAKVEVEGELDIGDDEVITEIRSIPATEANTHGRSGDVDVQYPMSPGPEQGDNSGISDVHHDEEGIEPARSVQGSG